MGGCLGRQTTWLRERAGERENPDSDRAGPGLYPGLLSGGVCASLSACLSSALLSILLKNICLLIIHPLLFWTDMFSLHQYFHHSSNGLFSALPRTGGSCPTMYFELEQYFTRNFLYSAQCGDTIAAEETNGRGRFYLEWHRKYADTVKGSTSWSEPLFSYLKCFPNQV